MNIYNQNNNVKDNNLENKKDEVTLEKVEQLRFDVFCTFVMFSIIFGVVLLFSLILLLNGMGLTSFGLLVFPAVFAFPIISRQKEIFNDAYKKYFLSLTLKDVFKSSFFDINKGINKSSIEETETISMGDIFRATDYFCGFYKDIKFEYSDIHILENKVRANETLFKGHWFIFDFNKKFKSNMQIFENTFNNKKKKKMLFIYKSNYKKVQLEDIEFNKIFSIFSQNEMETFYILTPNFVEKIKQLNNKIKGKFIFCFINNKLHVGLSNNYDSFNANMLKTLDEEKEKKKVYDEIKIIIDFIEMLNLDDTLFS